MQSTGNHEQKSSGGGGGGVPLVTKVVLGVVAIVAIALALVLWR